MTDKEWERERESDKDKKWYRWLMYNLYVFKIFVKRKRKTDREREGITDKEWERERESDKDSYVFKIFVKRERETKRERDRDKYKMKWF